MAVVNPRRNMYPCQRTRNFIGSLSKTHCKVNLLFDWSESHDPKCYFIFALQALLIQIVFYRLMLLPKDVVYN